jgi:hypothetical protein
MKYHENLFNGSELFRMYGRTDRHDVANSRELPSSELLRVARNAISLLTFRENLLVPFQGIFQNGTVWLSRNAGNELPLLAAY